MKKENIRLIVIVAFLGVFCSVLYNYTNNMSVKSDPKNISVNKNISYDKTSYECVAGEYVDAVIKTSRKSQLKSFGSNNFFLVKVKKNPDYSVKCINCLAVRIYCKRAGSTSVTAKTTDGDKVTIPIKISKKKNHKIVIEKKDIKCKKGNTVRTLITASSSNGKRNGIKSYYIDDTTVATLSKSSVQPKCVGCINVDVNCKNSGTTTLRAVSTLGDKDSSTVTVEKENHSISLSKSEITCQKGQTVRLDVTATGSLNNKYNGIKSVTVADSKIASISDSGIQPKCIGCRYKDVKCNNTGTTTITAVSTLGDTATAKVVVNSGTIKYDKANYTCKKGDKLYATIIASPYKEGIKTFFSDDIAIAALSISTTQPKCPGCLGVDITCRGTGSTNIKAISRTGITTNSVVQVTK